MSVLESFKDVVNNTDCDICGAMKGEECRWLDNIPHADRVRSFWIKKKKQDRKSI